MDYNEYNKIIMDNINDIDSNYKNTVLRQLSVFTSKEKIKEYIESKTTRIFLDYEIYAPFTWNYSNKLILKKNYTVTYPSSDIEFNKNNFLSYIPFSLSYNFYGISKKQNLISFKFNDWLEYFHYKFFKKNDNFNSSLNIELLVDSNFVVDIKKHYLYKTIKQDNVKTFSENNVVSFLFKDKNLKHTLFYLKYKDRHLFFKITKK